MNVCGHRWTMEEWLVGHCTSMGGCEWECRRSQFKKRLLIGYMVELARLMDWWYGLDRMTIWRQIRAIVPRRTDRQMKTFRGKTYE